MKPALVDTYAQFPFTLVSGAGARVRDADGRDYWDLYGGHAVALLGHNHPAVSHAVREQTERLTFYSNAARLEVRSRAAEMLCAFAPPGLDHVFFCNSGAEANENALKLAIRHTGQKRIAALEGGFHGRTLLALSATAGDKLREPFADLLCDCVRLRSNALEDVERIDETVAAVIVEPIQSMAGVVELAEPFLRALRERCTKVGALLIYDEIQTGLGRLGRPFVAGEFDVVPDCITLAKGLANGIPAGALLMSPQVASRVKIGDLGTTFGGGPVACAAIVAVLETLQRDELVQRAATVGERIRQTLSHPGDGGAGNGTVRQVLGRGGLIGLRLSGPARPVQQALLERGFITGTSGDPRVLRLLPPLTTPLEAFDELAKTLHEMGDAIDATLAQRA